MTRLTTRCIALAVAVLLLTGATALAATYEGNGREDPKVGISFEKTRGKVKGFTVENVRFFCADGHIFRDSTRVGRMRIRRTRSGERKFSGYFSNADGNQTARVQGRLKGKRRARGTLRLIAVFDKGGCDTRRVTWRARRLPGG